MIVMRQLICVFVALQVLVTTTAITESCINICKFWTKTKNHKSWPKLHECNCDDVNLFKSQDNILSSRKQKALLHDSPKYLTLSELKDGGIYYEPVEVYEKPEFQSYANKPMFDNNPFITYWPKRETTSLKPSIKDKLRLYGIQNENKNENVNEKQIAFEPTYLDIDFLQTGSIESMGRGDNENPQEIENELVECLDLNIILYFKQTKNSKALRQLWKKDIIYKYLYVNDSDLINAIEIKCNKTYKVMQKSLDEIISMIPKKENVKTSAKYDMGKIVNVVNSTSKKYDDDQQQNFGIANATTDYNFVSEVDSLETLYDVNKNKNIEPGLTDNKTMYKTPYKAVNTRSTLSFSTEDTTDDDNIADMDISSYVEMITETTINENISDSYYEDANYTTVISQNDDTILVVDKEGTSIENFVEPFLATTLPYETLTVTNSPLHNNVEYLENSTKYNNDKGFEIDNDYKINDVLATTSVIRMLNETTTEIYAETTSKIRSDYSAIVMPEINNFTKSNADKGFDNFNDYNNHGNFFLDTMSDISTLTTTEIYLKTTSNIGSDSPDIIIKKGNNTHKNNADKIYDMNDNENNNNYVNGSFKKASDISMLLNENTTKLYFETTGNIESVSPGIVIREVENITKNKADSDNDYNKNNYTNELLETTIVTSMLLNEPTTEIYLETTSNIGSESPDLVTREVNDVTNENEIFGHNLTAIYSKNMSNIVSTSVVSNELLSTFVTPRTDNNILKATPDVTGQLYFIFGSNYIPTHFVQKANGEIYLGLDGSSFCNKLFTVHDSLLLRSMCNCTESEKKFD